MYQNTHLEDYIQQLYKELSIEQPEQLNKYVIADQLNVGVYLTSNTSEAFYWQDRYYIFIDRNLDSRQRWQDFGHELCHVLRHSGHQGHMPVPFRELQEWQADNFMYHFCVPTFMLRKIHLPYDQFEAIRLISETFNVEYSLAVKRLEMYHRKDVHKMIYASSTEIYK
ncbi:phage portal protein [Sporosarcina sp. P34]|uniref:ImmA/IrrE family metallo-endopeptidase n=1 Tax=Sporosarcina sp. P34 TaxID=2048247 RepID=UPI000C1710CE|nr:ImmA/IrrE family metallo-endopeptidase [Sporosarcina sp. P34]PID16824.1 phage portal protein [Sporosarcina sp. P34]